MKRVIYKNFCSVEVWLVQRGTTIADEDLIDLRLLLEWHRSLPKPDRGPAVSGAVSASFTDVEAKRNLYAVRPVLGPDRVIWLDSSGFQVAQSISMSSESAANASRRDYEPINDAFGVRVVRSY